MTSGRFWVVRIGPLGLEPRDPVGRQMDLLRSRIRAGARRATLASTGFAAAGPGAARLRARRLGAFRAGLADGLASARPVGVPVGHVDDVRGWSRGRPGSAGRSAPVMPVFGAFAGDRRRFAKGRTTRAVVEPRRRPRRAAIGEGGQQRVLVLLDASVEAHQTRAVSRRAACAANTRTRSDDGRPVSSSSSRPRVEAIDVVVAPMYTTGRDGTQNDPTVGPPAPWMSGGVRRATSGLDALDPFADVGQLQRRRRQGSGEFDDEDARPASGSGRPHTIGPSARRPTVRSRFAAPGSSGTRGWYPGFTRRRIARRPAASSDRPRRGPRPSRPGRRRRTAPRSRRP